MEFVNLASEPFKPCVAFDLYVYNPQNGILPNEIGKLWVSLFRDKYNHWGHTYNEKLK